MKVIGAVAEKKFHLLFDTEQLMEYGSRAPRLWILVADNRKAYVYSKSADGLELVANARPDNRIGGESIAFMNDLAEWLSIAEKENAFDHLVLAAPSGTLEEIRNCLSPNVYDRVTAELEKEMTSMSVQQIETYLILAL